MKVRTFIIFAHLSGTAASPEPERLGQRDDGLPVLRQPRPRHHRELVVPQVNLVLLQLPGLRLHRDVARVVPALPAVHVTVHILLEVVGGLDAVGRVVVGLLRGAAAGIHLAHIGHVLRHADLLHHSKNHFQKHLDPSAV